MPADPTPTADKVPKKRTRTGCLVCRKRKHKCDMERHATPSGTFSCGRCLKGNKTCLWPVQEPAEARFAPYPASASSGAAFAPLPGPSSAASAPSTSSSSSTVLAPPLLPSVAGSAGSLPSGAPCSPDNWLDGFLTAAAPATPTGALPAQTTASPSSLAWPSPLSAFARGFDAGPSFDLAGWSPPNDAPTGSAAGQTWAESSTTGRATIESSKDLDDGVLPAELMELIGSQVQPEPGWQQHSSLQAPLYHAPTSTLFQMWPDAEERNLMEHFLLMVPNVLSQTPRSTFGVPPVHQPLERVERSVEVFFPFLDVPAFLNTPRGSSTASEALSLACMSIGAIHLQFLHQQSTGPASLAAQDRYGRLAAALVESSLALGQTSLLLSPIANASKGATAPLSKSREDLSHLLAACSASVLTRCFSGKLGHGAALGLAKQVVRALGGPAAMLRAEASGQSLLFPDATRRSSARKRLRIVRSLLEDLAGWDICLSLATGEPAAAAPVEGISDWLFRYGPPAGSLDFASGLPEGQEDWDTLTFTMLMSRIMFDLCSRVNALHARIRTGARDGTSPSTTNDDTRSLARQAEDLLLEVRIRSRDVLSAHPDLSFDGSHVEETRCSSLSFSNLEWALALEIFVRVELLKEDPLSAKVQTLALHVVNVIDERMRRGLNEFGSAWPIVIAGTMLRGGQERVAVERVLMGLACPFCFDMNGYFVGILREVWELQDAGQSDVTWRNVPKARAGLILF